MYSRRQRSTRNTAATTGAHANTNARTTRGRTSKAKHPRRGGGNPDTARIRASIERAPVVPWVKVMRPPSLHLRRTFLVEKWVRPSDLTVKEREVYDEKRKEKEKEHQRLLKWQQQKREQEEKEKERGKQLQQEQKESSVAEIEAKDEVQDVKEIETSKEKQENEISKLKPIFEPSAAIASTSTASKPPTTTANKTDKSEIAQNVEKVASQQMQDSSGVREGEEHSAVKPMFETAAAIASTATTSITPMTTVNMTDESEIPQTASTIASEQMQDSSRLRKGEDHSAVKPIIETAATILSKPTTSKTPATTASKTDESEKAKMTSTITPTEIQDPSQFVQGKDHTTAALTSKSLSTSQQTQASLIDTMENTSSKLLDHHSAIRISSQDLQQTHKDALLQTNANKMPQENFLAPVNDNQNKPSTKIVCNTVLIDNTSPPLDQEDKEPLLLKNGPNLNDQPQENFSTLANEEEQEGQPDAKGASSSTEPLAKKMRIE